MRSLPGWPFAVLAVVAVGFAVLPVVNAARLVARPGVDAYGLPKANKDYTLWYDVGCDVRAGEPLYRLGPAGEVRYMYPPTAAVLLFAPLSYLGPVGFTAAFALTTALAWFGCLYLGVRLATGRWRGHPGWYYFLCYASVGPYVYDLFLLGQVNLILLFLTLLSAILLQQRRPWAAGACLGFAIAVKVFPLPVLVYWAVRRQRVAILSAVLTVLVAVVVLPAAVRGPERNAAEVRQWFGLMLGDQSGNTMSGRSIIGFTRRNQSLPSLAHRLLRDVDAGERDGEPFRVNVAQLSAAAAQVVGFAAVCGLGVVLLAVTRLRFAPTPAAEPLEWGMVCTLAVLASPLSWTYFFCWLLPAWAVVLHAARSRRWVRLALVPVVGLFLSAFTENYDPLLQAYGVTAWGAVGLFLILAALRRQAAQANGAT